MAVVLVLLGLAPATKARTPAITKLTVEDLEKALPAVLLKIAECESHNKQFNPDGSVIRGKQNPKDVGRFQINEYWNGTTAKKLGYDIYTWEGNTKMALYLYDKRGTKDWLWSKWCWSK